ncbi:hypothetical protein MmiAt1_05810 [Methanimicrococcus sp. At1]|uniref:Uncharacterized protein n=1 Tax=Methanimicrococcus hacksteinii TaxID=3028293 RepID=A0ABU3VPE5_9EURY|nr:hypothetical protein [Methanimicrococcus sp. At1]MDV0445026.1 hypothetical protein [Methanimicrococcus sp. At1]
MELNEKYPDVKLLNPDGSILDIYTERYLMLGLRFYDLFKHDLKNHQNAVFMALDLYKLKRDEKYLDMIEEASQKSMEYIDIIKAIEPFVYNGGKPGFYSFYACMEGIIENYPDREFEIIGDDVVVFADAALPKLFDLLIQVTLGQEKEKHKLAFIISEFQENGLNKCNIEVVIHDMQISARTIETILNDDTHSVTGDMPSLTFYIAKMILYRYSGDLKLSRSGPNETRLTVSFLKEDNPASIWSD